MAADGDREAVCGGRWSSGGGMRLRRPLRRRSAAADEERRGNGPTRGSFYAKFRDLTESLDNLLKLQAIKVILHDSYKFRHADWDNCQCNLSPRHICHLELGIQFTRMPAWIDSLRLPHLTHVCLLMDTVDERDVEIVGTFPELVSLRLWTGSVVFPGIVGGGAFPKLRHFFTTAKLSFPQGVMPILEYVIYSIRPQVCYKGNLLALERDFASLKNLPCLERVGVLITSASATDLEETEAAFRHAVKVHPNNPALELTAVVVSEGFEYDQQTHQQVTSQGTEQDQQELRQTTVRSSCYCQQGARS